MPLKLTVGVSKKVGQPDYGSAGATCNLELELDAHLLESDLDGLHRQVRSAYTACRQAVHDELSRLQNPPTPALTVNGEDGRQAAHDNGHAHPVNGKKTRTWGGPARSGGAPARVGKPASERQVRADPAIARRVDEGHVEGLLREFGATRPEDLSMADASKVIDELKAIGAES